jgi:hypothetical protein
VISFASTAATAAGPTTPAAAAVANQIRGSVPDFSCSRATSTAASVMVP